jgi:hypothetical protein
VRKEGRNTKEHRKESGFLEMQVTQRKEQYLAIRRTRIWGRGVTCHSGMVTSSSFLIRSVTETLTPRHNSWPASFIRFRTSANCSSNTQHSQHLTAHAQQQRFMTHPLPAAQRSAMYSSDFNLPATENKSYRRSNWRTAQSKSACFWERNSEPSR